jgi:hypothetical protein
LNKNRVRKENLKEFLACPIHFKTKINGLGCEKCRLSKKEQKTVEENIRRSCFKEYCCIFGFKYALDDLIFSRRLHKLSPIALDEPKATNQEVKDALKEICSWRLFVSRQERERRLRRIA